MNSESRYRGRTPGQAMKKAREALGEDARLLGARRVSAPGLPPLYEVHVAAASAAAPREEGLDALRREIEQLREAISSLRPESSSPPPEPPKNESEEDPAAEKWLELLRRRGVGVSLARELVEAAGRDASGEHGLFEALRRVIANHFGVADPGEELGSRSAVFVGPAGAGKTTVLSKIASARVRRDESPVLVSTDGESIAGEETLSSVGEALGLRCETAFLDGRLEAMVERLGAGETYLVDTPGRAPFESEEISSLRRVVRSVPDAEVLLVVPATTDADEARLLIEGFSPLGVDRVILTKLDELYRPGRIVDLAKALSRPIAWVTWGRGVLGTSSAPDDPRVVSRILGTTLSVETSA